MSCGWEENLQNITESRGSEKIERFLGWIPLFVSAELLSKPDRPAIVIDSGQRQGLIWSHTFADLIDRSKFLNDQKA